MTWHEESSPNQLIFNLDTSQHKNFLSLVNNAGKLKLIFEFRENMKPKYSNLGKDYILGYGIGARWFEGLAFVWDSFIIFAQETKNSSIQIIPVLLH